MAINWILALKAVPWADVVQAAPHIVKGARRLFNSAHQAPTTSAGGAEPTPVRGAEGVHARLSQVEAALQNLDSEQQSSAELIRSLAEQNARVVHAIEVLRVRTRMLLGITIALSMIVVVVVVWTLTR